MNSKPLWKQIAMSTSAPVLLANFLLVYGMAAGHAEDFQIYVLQRP